MTPDNNLSSEFKNPFGIGTDPPLISIFHNPNGVFRIDPPNA